jgi:hypothetical protein
LNTFWTAVDQIAATVVKLWFCPHVHRRDIRRGGIVECWCLHCGEQWETVAYAYRGKDFNEEPAEKDSQHHRHHCDPDHGNDHA